MAENRFVCRVVRPYETPFSNPIVMKAGDRLRAEEKESEWPGWLWCVHPDGKSGWVPETYVERDGDSAIAVHDYDAAELTVQVGEELLIAKEEAGWFWCTNENGESGWVPTEHVEIVG